MTVIDHEPSSFGCDKYSSLIFCILYIGSILGVLSGVGLGKLGFKLNGQSRNRKDPAEQPLNEV